MLFGQKFTQKGLKVLLNARSIQLNSMIWLLKNKNSVVLECIKISKMSRSLVVLAPCTFCLVRLNRVWGLILTGYTLEEILTNWSACREGHLEGIMITY